MTHGVAYTRWIDCCCVKKQAYKAEVTSQDAAATTAYSRQDKQQCILLG